MIRFPFTGFNAGLIACSSSLLLLSGCQKNNYESCVEYQTAAATRAHSQYPEVYKDLQETIDHHVAVNCRGTN